jgi:hypothetical protein
LLTIQFKKEISDKMERAATPFPAVLPTGTRQVYEIILEGV